MWKFCLPGLFVLLLGACQPSVSEGFPPFLEDEHEYRGPSSCTWHPQSITLPDIGSLSFNYKNCDHNHIGDNSYYADGNWVYFDYYEDSPRVDRYPALGVFPLKRGDPETVLKEEVFTEELKNPLCRLVNSTTELLERHNQDPFPESYPNPWHLNSTDEIWDERGDTPELLEDACGPFARNIISKYGHKDGGYIVEKYDHIFVLRRSENLYEIDLFAIRFEPVRK